MRTGWIIGLAIAAGCLATPGEAAGPGGGDPSVLTPVVASVLGGETAPVPGSDGRAYVVYELLVTNAKRIPAEIQRIEVLDADRGRVLQVLEGDTLIGALHDLGAAPVENAALPSNESRLVFVSLGFEDVEAAPDHLRHRLHALAAANPGAREASPVQYEVASLDVSSHRAPTFRPPLRGAGWLAVNGCCDGSGAHRGAVQAVNGRLWDSQRFAIDWVQVDAEGRLFHGDGKKAADYVGYGATVHAAADGTVVAAIDGLEDQIPGELPDPTAITIDTVDGNHVVLDHGGGVYSFYAHFQPGSVQVASGDVVKAGQPLGRLGNTGNTSAPHLHFHVMTGPSPLGSDGIPFVYDAFTLTDAIDDDELDALLDGKALAPSTAAPLARENEMPLNLTVSTFP